MLVLRRTTNQQIMIDGDICITILAIEGQRVKIGIEAPRDTQVWRGELVEGAPVLSLADPELCPLKGEREKTNVSSNNQP